MDHPVSVEPKNGVQIRVQPEKNGTHFAQTRLLKLKALWIQKLIEDFHHRWKSNSQITFFFLREILSDNTVKMTCNRFIINKNDDEEKNNSYLLIYISEFFSFIIEVILKTQIKSWDFGKSRYKVALKLFGMMEGWNREMSSKICFVW